MALVNSKTQSNNIAWSENLRPKVGDSVLHNGSEWSSVNGINSEPGVGSDWKQLISSSGLINDPNDPFVKQSELPNDYVPETGGTFLGEVVFDDDIKINLLEEELNEGDTQTIGWNPITKKIESQKEKSFIPLVFNPVISGLTVSHNNLTDNESENTSSVSILGDFEDTASYNFDVKARFATNSGGTNTDNPFSKKIEYFLVFENGLFGTGVSATNEILLCSEEKTGNTNNFIGFFECNSIFQLTKLSVTVNTINWDERLIVNDVLTRTNKALVLRNSTDTDTIEGSSSVFSIKTKMTLSYNDPTNALGNNRPYILTRNDVSSLFTKIS